MGHVNNTLYFRYLETLRIEWFNALNCRPDPSGTGPVIVNAFCNFIAQVRYPGELIAKQYVANLGSKSFDTFATLERADAPGVITTTGGATVVWIDFPREKSVPIPPELRSLFAG
jgi:acyl-CoA thioester hydrolase